MSDIEDIADMEFGELLQQVHLGELHVGNAHTHVHVKGTVGSRVGSSG